MASFRDYKAGMKTTLISALGLALAAGTPIMGREAAPAPAAPQPPPPSALGIIAKELAPTAESLAHQSLSFLSIIHQTLAGAQDRESADKAADILKNMQKGVRHFQQACAAVTPPEWKKFEAAQKEMTKKGKGLIQDCRKEGSRLAEARYYGSVALKDILEDSEEFKTFADRSEKEPEH